MDYISRLIKSSELKLHPKRNDFELKKDKEQFRINDQLQEINQPNEINIINKNPKITNSSSEHSFLYEKKNDQNLQINEEKYSLEDAFEPTREIGFNNEFNIETTKILESEKSKEQKESRDLDKGIKNIRLNSFGENPIKSKNKNYREENKENSDKSNNRASSKNQLSLKNIIKWVENEAENDSILTAPYSNEEVRNNVPNTLKKKDIIIVSNKSRDGSHNTGNHSSQPFHDKKEEKLKKRVEQKTSFSEDMINFQEERLINEKKKNSSAPVGYINLSVEQPEKVEISRKPVHSMKDNHESSVSVGSINLIVEQPEKVEISRKPALSVKNTEKSSAQEPSRLSRYYLRI